MKTKTKKTGCLLLSFLLLFSALASCAPAKDPDDDPGKDPKPEPEVELAEFSAADCGIVYRAETPAESAFAKKFTARLNELTGQDFSSRPDTTGEEATEILLGTCSRRDAYKDARLDFMDYVTDAMGVYVIRRTADGKLVVAGNTPEATGLAAEELLSSYIRDGKLAVPKDIDLLRLYDAASVGTGKVHFYTAEELDGLCTLSGIVFGTESLAGFDGATESYTVKIPFNEGYPTRVRPAVTYALSETELTLPTAENGGLCSVVVTAANGVDKKTYRIQFEMSDTYTLKSEVTVKDGKKGTLTMVFDDGLYGAASFLVDEVMPKYSSFRATCAIITRALATLETETDENGDTVYRRDKDGNYVYTVTGGDDWAGLLRRADGRLSLASHSVTHRYWGDDDNGGSYYYKKNDGTYAYSEVFPKGNVTAELRASRQILRDLFPGQNVYTFIKPGVGAVLSKYYTDLLETGVDYIGARTTVSKPEDPQAMLNFAQELRERSARFNIKAYMVQHYNTDPDLPTTKDSTDDECLATDIVYWRNYVDAAISGRGWACFCFHQVVADNAHASGHYVYRSQVEKLAAYAEEKKDDLWIACFDDAMIYYNEWSTASVTATSYRDEYVDVSLVTEERGEMYTMPLTVKVTLPDGWKSAAQDGRALRVFREGTARYVYVDVAPGATVRLSPSV